MRFSRAAIAALGAGTIAGTMTFAGAAADASTTTALAPTADAYVESSSPSTNFGATSILRIDDVPNGNSSAGVTHSYLKFDVEGLSSPVLTAALRVYAIKGNNGGFTVTAVSDDSWQEQTLTWNNAPPIGVAAATTSGAFSGSQWVSVDVTPLVSGNGVVSLALTSTTSPSPMTLASKENSPDLAPQLVVETAPVAPSNNKPPTISGTAEVGQTLTATPGIWSENEPLSYAYDWLRCDVGGESCNPISGASGSTYTVVSADAGSTLRVEVTATNSAGSSTATSDATAVVIEPTPSDTTPPSAPTALHATSAAVSIALTWSASTDNVAVAGYDIYLAGSKVGSTTSTTFTFTGLACGSSYTLGVLAFDAAGNPSSQSTITSATAACPDTTPPSAPSNLAVSAATTTSLTLAWSASTDNVAVAGYDIYLAGSKVGSTTSTTFTFTGLACGSSYTLGVLAFDAAGNPSSQSTITSATAPCTGSSAPCGTASDPPMTYEQVVWIVFENHSYPQIIGSSAAPYFNQLASQCGLATNFYAETHPSLPNYLAMVGGSTFGITDDAAPSLHPISGTSLFGQTGGGSYDESMPLNCYLLDSVPYIVHHNPQAYFTGEQTLCSLTNTALFEWRSFELVTPNNCNNMHDCSVSTGDMWLKNFLPSLLSSSTYTSGGTAIFITFDEDDDSAGNHVVTLVLSPYTPVGARSSTQFNHYSMLRTTEDLLGISTHLGNAASAASMRAAFGL
jgi:chitodextrinase